MASITSSVVLVVAFALLASRPLASAFWEDCKTTKMILKNAWMNNNIEVISYSRLSADQSVGDCLNKCRSNEECYSFNYNKLTKWCYIGTTEETDLSQTKSGKWAAGYRRCVEHVSNDPWTNDEFAGGAQGTEPTAVTNVVVSDAEAQNTINFSFTAQSTPGTTAEGAASTIARYKVTCSPTSGSYPAVTKTYPGTVAAASGCATNAAAAAAGCQFGGLAADASYTCSITPINAEGLEGPTAISSMVTVVA